MANLPDLSNREVIIGSGPAATVYAATRAELGYPKPVMLEKADRAGGMFEQLKSRFWLNSANDAGFSSTSGGPTRLTPKFAGDDLNHLPNCDYQVASVCSTEYPDSRTVGDTVRRNAERYADVYTGVTVTVADIFGVKPRIGVDGKAYDCGRLIDARGLTPNRFTAAKDGTPVITGDMFFRGQVPGGMYSGAPKRVAVIGGGDMGVIVIENLLGQSPDGRAFKVSEIGWYATDLPVNEDGYVTKDSWLRAGSTHARYLGLARHLPQNGVTGLIRPYQESGIAVSLGRLARVNGENYDLVIACTGYRPAFTDGDSVGPTTADRSGNGLWRNYGKYYVVGTAANLSYLDNEYSKGYTRFPKNKDALFRNMPEVAKLAATLAGI